MCEQMKMREKEAGGRAEQKRQQQSDRAEQTDSNGEQRPLFYRFSIRSIRNGRLIGCCLYFNSSIEKSEYLTDTI